MVSDGQQALGTGPVDSAPWQVLQIAPNDHPPFGDILSTYQLALARLGASTQTLVLAPPTAEPVAGCTYLGLEDLANVRRAGRCLRETVHGVPVLALCHRYRAYRVLRASRVRAARVVAIAHEFGFFRRAQRRLEQKLLARQVQFAGVSPAVQAELAASVAEPLCLPNALDVAAMQAACLTRQAALAALGVPESDALTIGLVGRLVDKKSPQLAVDAVRVLTERGVAVRLLVIGDGPLAAPLRAQAGTLPVIFCGFVAGARNLMRALDVLLLTSREVEAFGMVALEAMIAGVPVVTGPTPGPQFVLGGSGFYYTQRHPEQIADAILEVRNAALNGELPERAAHAEARAERAFSVPALAAQLRALLPPDQDDLA